jgi:hypothetical protein
VGSRCRSEASGAEIGFLSVLHTWGQTLQRHPHIHCVVPGGGLSPDHQRWVPARAHFFLPVRVLSRVFRGKFVAGLKRLFRKNKRQFFGACQALSDARAFAALLRSLFREEWVVYAKPPFGGPAHVLQYLARYTHRVAISNHRLLSVTDAEVTFRWKDYAHGSKQRAMTLPHAEFLRRFLQHVLPTGFPRIRYFGFLAHRRRRLLLPLCRNRLSVAPIPVLGSAPARIDHRCPRCQASMRLVERFTAQELSQEKYDQIAALDSS